MKRILSALLCVCVFATLLSGITNGTGGTAFSPNTTCTRAQIVTFLHRYYVTPLDNSALITDLTNAATQTVTSMTLDPNPPEDYKKQTDCWTNKTNKNNE